MDCFYAAVEVRDNPELKGKPVAVGGLSGGRGVISAANYEARKFGVRSALSSAVAIRKCPQLILVRPNMQKYVEDSKKIQAIFYSFTNLVEPLSLDEAYLDVSESEYFQGSASLLATEIRKQIFESTGLTASAGIAPNKFLAKVASDWNKPNGQFVITPDMVDAFVVNLAIEKISGVGKVTAKKIHEIGINTCGDLQKLSKAELVNRFGSFGHSLYQISRGIDNREVVTSRERKSLSIERTFSHDLPTIEECLAKMPMLFESFEKRYLKKRKHNGHHDEYLSENGQSINEDNSNIEESEHISKKLSKPIYEKKRDEIKPYDNLAENHNEYSVESNHNIEKIDGLQTMKKQTLFVKIKFSDFTSTTTERSFDLVNIENFTKLLNIGITRKDLPVRLIGLGVRFKSHRKTTSNLITDGTQLLLFDH